MRSLGDVSSRQKDLRDRLLAHRNTLTERDQKEGFSESKECIEKENRTYSESVDKRSDSKKPVEGLVRNLHVELERMVRKERQEQLTRSEEKAELLQLRAERESFLMERFRGDSLKDTVDALKQNLETANTRLELAMDELNCVTFEKACMDQQVAEWKKKISTYTSNVKEMATIKDREKDIGTYYRAAQSAASSERSEREEARFQEFAEQETRPLS